MFFFINFYGHGSSRKKRENCFVHMCTHNDSFLVTDFIVQHRQIHTNAQTFNNCANATLNKYKRNSSLNLQFHCWYTHTIFSIMVWPKRKRKPVNLIEIANDSPFKDSFFSLSSKDLVLKEFQLY